MDGRGHQLCTETRAEIAICELGFEDEIVSEREDGVEHGQ